MTLSSLDTICLTMAANSNEIEGRATIQKLIYFEMQKIKELDITPHVDHYFGPFNGEVMAGLETLVYINVLSEKRLTMTTYAYKIEEKGIPVIEKLKNENKKTYEKIEKIVQICKKCCSLKQNPLSIAAKIHYIMVLRKKSKKSITNNKVIEIAETFGWEITKKDIKTGANLLGELELVRIE